jgi:seryl-tRNA synthetase
MSDAITRFSLHLQTHVKDMQNRFAALTSSSDLSLEHAGHELRTQITALEEKASKAKEQIQSSAVLVQKWVDDSVATVEDWKARMDVSMLKARAERADHYAKAAADVATASIDEAAKAALAAKLAHADAAGTPAPKTVA